MAFAPLVTLIFGGWLLAKMQLRKQKYNVESSSLLAMAAITSVKPEEVLEGDEKASWDECMDYATETLGLDPEDAYDSLAASFGWTPRSKAFWKTKKEVVPTVEEVQNTVSYLKAKIGFSDEDITKVARDFPQALGLSESDIDYTVNHMQKELNLKGDMLTKSLLRKPERLGKNIWCAVEGDGACLGQCTRCWATM
jgi:hypothetical protein